MATRLAPVTNTDGEDISGMVDDAAAASGLDPVALLALITAESGLNPKAERWGTRTQDARAAIAASDTARLAQIIDRTWPDISFGYSQRIVRFHEVGDQSSTVSNCLAVREHVFAHPGEDIIAAARRLAGCFQHSTCDGTPLSAMVVYNAGSDRRGEPEWLAQWSGNVASYQRALERAEQFRLAAPAESGPQATPRARPEPRANAAAALDIMWGNWEQVKRLAAGLRRLEHTSTADELDRLAADSQSHFVTVKQPLGLE